MWWQHIFTCGRPTDISKGSPTKRPTSSIRGHLVRSYNTNIEEDFYLDREHELGKGGCGIVVVGEHKQTRGQYAIKIINKSTAERGRLDRELKLLKDVDHTNIVRLFSVYDTSNHMYFVMELCMGGHLGNLLSRQPNKCVDEEWAKKLCRQLLSAVAHIHSRGIAHRDIKLQNILIDSTIDRNAQLKLIDFGYGSRYIGALPMKTKCGTPYTTAPEVIREHYDQRCDVWSCGVVLYIMLCGRRPFEAIDVGGPLSDAGKAAMITNILAGRYHFNHKQWQNVSRQGLNFVKALLTQDYRHRMHSHEALESPWLKDDQLLANQNKLFSSGKGARAVSKLKQSTDHNEFQRAGMVALVFGIPSRAATDLRAVFQSFDVDSSGTLSRKEFHGALSRLAPDLSHDDVERLFDIVDIDKNQQISYTEFLVATLDPRDVDIEELNKAFRLLDEDGNGIITRDEMRKVVKQMLQQQLDNSNETASDLIQLSARPLRNSTGDYLDDLVEQRLETIFAQVDKDNDGHISHSEFIWAMTGMDPAILEANHSQQQHQQLQLQLSKTASGSLSPAPALGKVSSGYFHTSDRFSRRPNADSSVQCFNGLSFKGNTQTLGLSDTDSQQPDRLRRGSSSKVLLSPVASSSSSSSSMRQPSLRNMPKHSFRGQGPRTILEESGGSAATSSSGRVSSLRPLPVSGANGGDITEQTQADVGMQYQLSQRSLSMHGSPPFAGSRGQSSRQLSLGLPAPEWVESPDVGAGEHLMTEEQKQFAQLLQEEEDEPSSQNTGENRGGTGQAAALHDNTVNCAHNYHGNPNMSSPMPQYKGMLARSQKSILGEEDGDEHSPRSASVRLETWRGNRGSLALPQVQDDLDLPDSSMILQLVHSGAMLGSKDQEEQSQSTSSSSYNTSRIVQLFGPPARAGSFNNTNNNNSSNNGSHNGQSLMSSPARRSQLTQFTGSGTSVTSSAVPFNGATSASTSASGTVASATSGGAQLQLGSVKETKVYFTAAAEDSGYVTSETDNRRNSVSSFTSNRRPSQQLSQHDHSLHPSVDDLSESHSLFQINNHNSGHPHSNNDSSSCVGSSTPQRAQQEQQHAPVVRAGSQRCMTSSIIEGASRFTDVASVAAGEAAAAGMNSPTASGPVPMSGTPKLTRLNSKFAGSFKRDTSNKYMIDANEGHLEERADAEPIPPSLSRLGSRAGVSLSARSQRDLDSTSSQEMSVPMTSPSFLANIKRMMSASHMNQQMINVNGSSATANR